MISALFLAPLVVGILYMGGAYFVCLVAIAAGFMTAEWRQLSNNGKLDFVGVLGVSIVVLIIVISFLQGALWGALSLGTGILLVYIAARRHIDHAGTLIMWFVPGVVSVGCLGIGLVWLREFSDSGFLIVLWLVVTIWMTDICALFVGRFLGGPKLAKTISPNKTWSGLMGGILGAALWSGVWSYSTGMGSMQALAIIGGGTAVLAQLGDLSVSVVKRRFGAKDTGNIIPGHG